MVKLRQLIVVWVCLLCLSGIAANLEHAKFVELAKGADTRDEFLSSVHRRFPHLFSLRHSLLQRFSNSPCRGDFIGKQPGEYPGMLHFDKKTKILFRFFGNPNGECQNVVEAFAYTGRKGHPWDTYLIEWGKEFRKNPVVLKNDRSCQNCHGNPPLPIFARNDAVWFEYYGAFAGQIRKNSVEAKQLDYFLKNHRKEFPYSLLEGFAKLSSVDKLPREGEAPHLRINQITGVFLRRDGKPAHQPPQVIPNMNAFSQIMHAIPDGSFHRLGLALRAVTPIQGIALDCFNCHVVGRPEKAVAIAFDNEKQLAKDLQNPAFLNKLMKAIESDRMPRHRELYAHERKKLLETIKRLSSK